MEVTFSFKLSAVTSEKKFTAEKKDGTVEMQFTFDAEKLQGDDVVVFEDLIHNGITVTSHADLSDKNQTVHFPKKPDTPPETPAPPKTGDRTKLLGYGGPGRSEGIEHEIANEPKGRQRCRSFLVPSGGKENDYKRDQW